MKISAGHCQFPTGPDSVCGVAIPPRTGPGRPKVYCTDPSHNPVTRLRAARRYAAAEAAGTEDPVTELAHARRAIAETERARHKAEREAHAARRERDAALAMRDLARDEVAEVRAEAADTVSRIRADCDREVARMAAVADAEIEKAVTARTLGDREPRQRISAV
ncbi:hypothetical protein [Nocardia sp. NPDC059239]|uniref:hypothetical protein n=1 Tax=unclassified Nocardia TaxID=2637762 RepID=UPI0036A3E57E